eukprot:1158768-Pelagomonas_calceolata.AAC.10
MSGKHASNGRVKGRVCAHGWESVPCAQGSWQQGRWRQTCGKLIRTPRIVTMYKVLLLGGVRRAVCGLASQPWSSGRTEETIQTGRERTVGCWVGGFGGIELPSLLGFSTKSSSLSKKAGRQAGRQTDRQADRQTAAVARTSKAGRLRLLVREPLLPLAVQYDLQTVTPPLPYSTQAQVKEMPGFPGNALDKNSPNWKAALAKKNLQHGASSNKLGQSPFLRSPSFSFATT